MVRVGRVGGATELALPQVAQHVAIRIQPAVDVAGAAVGCAGKLALVAVFGARPGSGEARPRRREAPGGILDLLEQPPAMRAVVKEGRVLEEPHVVAQRIVWAREPLAAA